MEDDGRYRGNLFLDRSGLNATFRVIPEQPPTLHELGLPPNVAEIAIIQDYLPQQMTGDELLGKVREVAESVGYEGPKDTGKFMKEWMAQYKGQADGRDVQNALKSL